MVKEGEKKKNIENVVCGLISVPFLIDFYNRKHPGWRHHKLAWFVQVQDRRALSAFKQGPKTKNITGTVPIYRASMILVKLDVRSPKDATTVCSSCSHLTKDTAVPPDYRNPDHSYPTVVIMRH